MTPALFGEDIGQYLERISRFFILRRKPVRDAIIDLIAAAQTRHEDLDRAKQDAEARLQPLREENHALLTFNAQTQSKLENVLADHAELARQLEAARTDNAGLLQQQKEAQARAAGLTVELDEARSQLQDSEQARVQEESRHADTLRELGNSEVRYENAAKSRDHFRLQLDELSELHSELKQEKAESEATLDLLSRLISAQPQANTGLDTFRQLLNNDYMEFAGAGSSLKGEAAALQKLQSIYHDAESLARLGDVAERTLVGVLGGFSSGKSEFINSFLLDREIRLAVGLQPITAIPTYVVSSDERAIRAHTANGSSVAVDNKVLRSLSHANFSNIGLDLRPIVRSLHVATEMDQKLFSNICVLDTPGYNPPGADASPSASDRVTALNAMKETSAILWVIAAEVNGTVPDSDLDFFLEADIGSRSVYVVLNKADLRSEEELEEIMDEIEDVLKGARIAYKGISAYSSVRRQEIAYRKKKLHDHLRALNKRRIVKDKLLHGIADVFVSYDAAIEQDIQDAKKRERAINSLELDALEIGGKDLHEKMQKTIHKLASNADLDALRRGLALSQSLYDQFYDAVELVWDGPSRPDADAMTDSADQENNE